MCVRVKVKSPSGVEINTSIKTLRRKKKCHKDESNFRLKSLRDLVYENSKIAVGWQLMNVKVTKMTLI